LTDQGISYGQGALRAQEITDMLGVVGRDEVASLLRGLAGGSAAHLLQLSAELAERSVDFADVLKGLLEALHDLSVECALRGAVDDFSAEELQLYYQIALLGHRDLNISPDERSGFEMTLLRMLAFSPHAGSQVPPRVQGITTDPGGKAQAAQSATKQAEQPQTTENLQKDTQHVEQNVAQSTVTVGTTADEQWFEIVAKLDVGGVTRMIAEHSVLQKIQLPNIELLLDSGHDTMLNAAQVDHLCRALSEALGQPVELQVNTGTVESETPAQRRERQQQERQARAEQTISEDANVRDLVAQFGGRVDQIRPI
jgi:DNA polymerase-3 subunit gamma/tau